MREMGFVNWLRDKINPVIEEPEESFAEQEARAEAKLEDIYADSVAQDADDALEALSEDQNDEMEEEEVIDDIVAAIDVGDVDATSLLDDEIMEDFSDIDMGDLEAENVDVFTSDDHLLQAFMDDDEEGEDGFTVEIINTEVLDDDFEVLDKESTASTEVDDAKNLSKLKVAELKEMCRERGLPVSGKKTDLIERLS